MNKKWFNISFVVIATIALISCGSKKTGTESLVPSDAKVVIAINPQQLMDKLAKGGINVDDLNQLPQLLADSTTKSFTSFWKEGSKTGIDFTQPIVLAFTPVENRGEMGNEFGAMRLVAGIKNKDSFITFLKETKSDLTIDKGDVTYITDDEDMCLAISKKYVVALESNGLRKYSKDGSRETLSKTEIKEALKKAIQLSGSKSILSNSDYTKVPTAQNDVKIWSDVEYMAANNQNMDATARNAYSLMKDALKGSSSTTVLNFEDGKVTTKSLLKFNNEMTKVLNKTAAQTIDLTMLNNFPGQTLNGIFGVSMNPNTINDFAKFINQEAIMNMALSKMNIKSSDLFDAFTGDAIFVLSDMNATNIEQKQLPNMGFLIKVKDKAKLDKLLTFPEIARMIKPEGNLFTIKDGEFATPNYMGFANNIMIISPNKATVETYIAGTAKNSFDASKLALLKDKSAGYYFDVQSIGTVVNGLSGTFLPNQEQGTIVRSVLSMFTNTHMTSSGIKDGYVESSGVLNLTNNSVNSLAYMIKTGFRSYLTFEKGNDMADMPTTNGTNKIDLSDVDAETGDRVVPMKVK